MNTKLFWKACLSVMMLTCALTQPASATVDPISLNIYPTSTTIPYGANGYSIQLQYYVVSNVPDKEQKLSGYSFAPVTPPSVNPITSITYSDNCNGILPSQKKAGTCTIFVNLKANGNPVGTSTFLSPVNYQFSFKYGPREATMTSSAAPLVFATGKKIDSLARTFSFANTCGVGDDVWIGIASGASPAITPNPAINPPDANSCLTDTDCYPGSTCKNVAAGLDHCLWNNPVPQGGSYKIAPSGTPIQVTFDVYDNGIDQQWTGGIAARTGCTDPGYNCTVADCGSTSGNAACPVPGGFATPNTTVEFTLQGIQALVTNTSGYPDNDTYDVTVINGFVGGGLSIQPTNAASWNPANPYKCGTPGSANATAPLGSCNWSANPPVSPPSGHQSDYVWVTSTTGSCPNVNNPNGGCTSPQVCGHTIVGATVSPGVFCGTQLGLLTADAVCAIDSTFGAPFNCQSTVTQDISYTYREIYGCSKGEFKQSCYTAAGSTTCCGCQNWDIAATYPSIIPSTTTGLTQSCGTSSNPNWITIAEPNLAWVKQACPTAYVFPFDDASSTFTCQVLNANNVNTTNYAVTFCPVSGP